WWAKSTTTKFVPSIVMTIPRRMPVALIIMALRVAPGKCRVAGSVRQTRVLYVRASATCCLDPGNALDTTRCPAPCLEELAGRDRLNHSHRRGRYFKGLRGD